MKITAPHQKEESNSGPAYSVNKAVLNPLQLKNNISSQAISSRQNPLQLIVDGAAKPNNNPLQLQAKRENKTGLPDKLKENIEAQSGFTMDDVRVHYNSGKPAQLHALAYAQGADIHIAPGQEKHLPHEAWHVVQQKQGRVKATMQMKGGVQINDNIGLEKEADVMGKLSENPAPDQLKNLNRSGIDVNSNTTISQAGNSSIQSNVIQGRFGFEIELNMLLTSERQYKGSTETFMAEPEYLKMPVVATSNNFSVHADHRDGNSKNQKDGAEPRLDFGKIPIVELVTRPMDEFKMTEDQVATVMQELVDFANDANTKTGSFTHRAPLQNIQGINTVPAAPTFIGSDRKSLVNPLVGNIQMTQGIRLDRVSPYLNKYIKQASGVNNPKGKVNKSDEIIIKSRNAAARTIVYIWENYKDPGKKADQSSRIISNSFQAPDLAGLSRLEGLIILISNYLIAGNTDTGSKGWLKNYTGSVFYKSELSSVVDQLTGFEKKLIEKRYSKIADLILTNTGRSGNEPVIFIKKNVSDPDTGDQTEKVIRTKVLCKEWILEVLQGKQDRVFRELKNAYASQIEPEKIGTRFDSSLAVIIENRKLADLLTTKGRNPGDWVNIGKEAFRLLLELNS